MSDRAGSLLFFLLVLFLAGWHLDEGHNDNTMARAATVAALVDRGTMEIGPVQEMLGDKCLVNGRYYSDKAPLPTFAVVPFHWLAVKTGLAGSGEHGTLTDGLLRLGGFICGSLPFALLVWLAWRMLRAGRHPLPLSPAVLATLPFFGSFLFVYSGSFYNHLPEALFAVLAARALERGRPVVAGLCAGAAFLCGSAMLLLAAVWGAQLLFSRQWRHAVNYGLGLLPALVASALYNQAITGNPFVFPNAYAVNYGIMHQQYGFGTWQPAAFLGLLISDYRGLLFYMPFLVIGLLVLPTRLKARQFLTGPFVLPAVLLIAAFLTHATWGGGWTYGPRYIMASAALLAFATLKHFPAKHWAVRSVWVLCGFGILCAFAAKSTVWYSFPTEMMHPITDGLWNNLMQGNWTTWQWPVALGLSRTAAVLAFPVIFAITLYFLVRLDRSITHAPVPLP